MALEERWERRRAQGAKKLAVFLFHFPFIRYHLQGLELSCVVLSFHILTESKETKPEVGDILGQGLNGHLLWFTLQKRAIL